MKKGLLVIAVIVVLGFVFMSLPKGEDYVYFSDNYGCSGEYRNTDVSFEHNVSMASDETFSINVKSVSGEIGMSIRDSKGKSVYDGVAVPTSEFEVSVDHADTYTISVNGKYVSGEFEVKRILE